MRLNRLARIYPFLGRHSSSSAPLESKGKPTKFADVAHGAVVIEYEPTKSFSGRAGAKAIHARQQAEEYGVLIAAEEGRALQEYVLVAWDGAHITFGYSRWRCSRLGRCHRV